MAMVKLEDCGTNDLHAHGDQITKAEIFTTGAKLEVFFCLFEPNCTLKPQLFSN